MLRSKQIPRTRQFILWRDGQQIVYDIHDSRVILRKRNGRYHKYLIGFLPSGIRFAASYGLALPAEVRRWEKAHGITAVQRCLERALHAVVNRLAAAAGLSPALKFCIHAVEAIEAQLCLSPAASSGGYT